MSANDAEFHALMRRLYREQREVGTMNGNKNDNSYLVSAKLPCVVYRKFYDIAKQKGWSKSTLLQYAIHQLITGKTNDPNTNKKEF